MKKNIPYFFYWGLFCLLFFIFIFPSAFKTLDEGPMEVVRFSESIFFSILFWGGMLAIFRKIASFLIFFSPVAIFIPIEIWVRNKIGHPTSSQTLSLAIETSTVEVTEFIKTYGLEIGLLLLCWTLFYASMLKASIFLDAELNIKIRKNLLLYAILLLLVLYIHSGTYFWLREKEPSAYSDVLDGVSFVGWSQQWRYVFPLNIWIAFDEYQFEKEKLKEIESQLVTEKIVVEEGRENAVETVVLVIGESSTVKRWSLLGYERTTNPLLMEQKNLIAFSDVLALSTSTRSAIPGVLSPNPIMTPNGLINKKIYPSMIEIFNSIGYQTYWISNQSAFGKFDTSIAFYGKKAKNVVFINPSDFSFEGRLDEALITPLDNALHDNFEKKFIVLHTMGSHFDYSMRYSEKYNKFTPSLTDKKTTTHQQELVNNSYDNTILYTDYFLNEVIEKVKKQNKNSMVVYFSDHGVDVSDNDCSYKSPSRNSESSYRVPVLFWFSENLVKEQNKAYQQLIENKNNPYTNRAIFRSIFDVLNIKLADFNKNSESFLKKSDLIKNPRNVAYGKMMIDFDVAKNKIKCFISN